ncbi:MAG TPA: recombinase family protein, partial [Candidatus Dormibacteraeota bacterium]
MAAVQPSAGEVATAIYARISEDRQDGAGIARQLGDCLSLCRRQQDWGEPREYIDNDTSAWRSGTRRPRYQSMLEAIRVGEVGRIVVYHVDRLYRQPRDLEELIDLAEQGRVEVVTVVSGEIDLRTSDGRFVARLLVSVAAKESDDKSRRIRRQKQQAREEGRWH